MQRSLFLSAFVVLAGCSEMPRDANLIQPSQAIEYAARAAPGDVFGTYDVHVRSVGDKHDLVFLNTEDDYRDQRNLTVEITPAAAAELEKEYGAPAEPFLLGKHITVKGKAARVKVWFVTDAGAQSDKYYYQTHVSVESSHQIQIVP